MTNEINEIKEVQNPLALTEDLEKLSSNINTINQFYEFIHSEQVSQYLGEVYLQVGESNISDLKELEEALKQKVNEDINLKSSIDKRVRIMVRASSNPLGVMVSFFPKWLPRNPSYFKSKESSQKKVVKSSGKVVKFLRPAE